MSLPVAATRLDCFNAHVALFGTVDGDRPVLRVDERKLQFLRRPVVDRFNRAAESVERLGSDDVAGCYREDRGA
jgi:hypothetical protein